MFHKFNARSLASRITKEIKDMVPSLGGWSFEMVSVIFHYLQSAEVIRTVNLAPSLSFRLSPLLDC